MFANGGARGWFDAGMARLAKVHGWPFMRTGRMSIMVEWLRSNTGREIFEIVIEQCESLDNFGKGYRNRT